MTRLFEVKTNDEGQQDVFKVLGDYMEDDSDLLRIFKKNEGAEVLLIATFRLWTYAVELPIEVKKTPDF